MNEFRSMKNPHSGDAPRRAGPSKRRHGHSKDKVNGEVGRGWLKARVEVLSLEERAEAADVGLEPLQLLGAVGQEDILHVVQVPLGDCGLLNLLGCELDGTVEALDMNVRPIEAANLQGPPASLHRRLPAVRAEEALVELCKGSLELLHEVCVCRVLRQVHLLRGVGFHVEELPLPAMLDVHDRLDFLRRNAGVHLLSKHLHLV
mmetsp:Transcript_37041/g.95655  ORF Transcript_37041/g.95655 Transcript_37041/m.95655 type:complete len:204 (+) Transcript_37041:46-657(+)